MKIMIDKEAALKDVTNDTPVFMQVDLYETPAEYRDDYEMPYASAKVATLRFYADDSDRMITMAVLESSTLREAMFRQAPRMGDYVSCLDSEMDGRVIPETPELKQAYADFRKMHDEAPYQVSAALYSETPSYFSYDTRRAFPTFKQLEGSEQTWDLSQERLADGSAVDSLEAAEKWVLENHPAYVQGMSISQKCPSGNFMMTAVPCAEYPQGQFETFDGRLDYARSRAAQLGVTIGPERAQDMWKDHTMDRRLPETPVSEGPEVDGPEFE